MDGVAFPESRPGQCPPAAPSLPPPVGTVWPGLAAGLDAEDRKGEEAMALLPGCLQYKAGDARGRKTEWCFQPE